MKNISSRIEHIHSVDLRLKPQFFWLPSKPRDWNQHNQDRANNPSPRPEAQPLSLIFQITECGQESRHIIPYQLWSTKATSHLEILLSLVMMHSKTQASMNDERAMCECAYMENKLPVDTQVTHLNPRQEGLLFQCFLSHIIYYKSPTFL